MSDHQENLHKALDQGSVDEKLNQALQQAEDNLRGWQRAVADFENYKKRDEQFHGQLLALGQEQVLEVFISLFEDFNRLMIHLPQSPEALAQWVKGAEGVKKRIEDAFREIGIEKIKSVGEKFNPEIHDAVGQVEGGEDGIVAEEVSAGYRREDRVLKPAQVKVYRKSS